MNQNEKTTVSEASKAAFETPFIEIIYFTTDDIITTSGGFSGDDDIILPEDNF